MRQHILVSDPMSEPGRALLQSAGFQVEYLPAPAPEQLQEAVTRCDAWIVRSATRATAELIERAAKLKVIGRAGTGVDNVDVQAASKRGVIVMNVPGANTTSAAELTFALLAALARHIPQAHASMHEGRWDRKSYTGEELYGKTLGVVGFGRIGQAVAVRARAFEMKVLAFDPYLAPDVVAPAMERVSFEDLLPRCDYVTVHVPLSAETRGLFGREAFARMKPGARLIQCSRGGVVDEVALHEALASGRLGGAALDVYEKEPPGDSPLLKRPNVICTPHLGASTIEAQENVSVLIAEQVTAALLGREIGRASCRERV